MKRTLEDIFSEFQPDLGDKDEYIQSLSKKLEAIEMIKEIQDAEIKKKKWLFLKFFLFGLVVGGLIISLVLIHPQSIIDLDLKLSAVVIEFIKNNTILISAGGIILTVFVSKFIGSESSINFNN